MKRLRNIGLVVLIALVGLSSRGVLANPPDVLTLMSNADIASRRGALINFIWGSPTLSATPATAVAVTGNCSQPNFGASVLVQELRVPMSLGQVGVVCHFYPAAGKPFLNQAVVFNPGHTSSIADGSNWSSDSGFGDQRLVKAMLDAGFGVLVQFMPGHAPTEFNGGDPHPGMFANLAPPQGTVWQYFLQPINAALNFAGSAASPKSYTKFHMVGLSGGGWTAAVYAALDERLATTIQIAGSEPLEFWNGVSDAAEQTSPGLYTIAAYRDLYLMGTSNGRREIQILNRGDNCCFMPGWLGGPNATWDADIRNYERDIRSRAYDIGTGGVFRLEIDEVPGGHQISRNAAWNIVLPELLGMRRHVGSVSSANAFARGMNGNIWHLQNGVGWRDTGLASVGVPAVLENAVHGIDIYYRDPSNRLRTAYQNGNTWISSSLGGVIITDPAAVSWAPGRYDVFAFGGDYRLYQWSSVNAGYVLPIGSIQGIGTPVAVSNQADRLDVFYREMSESVGRLSWNGAWSTQSLGGRILGWPSAATNGLAGGAIDVYGVGKTYRLNQRSLTSGAWTAWANVSTLAGSSHNLSSSPSSFAASGIIQTSARMRDGRLLLLTRNGGTWQKSVLSYAGGFTGSPQAVASNQRWTRSRAGAAILSGASSATSQGGVIE